jgi:hypothetical protein
LYAGAEVRRGNPLRQTGAFGAELVLQDRQGGPVGCGADHPAYYKQLQRAGSFQSDWPVHGQLHKAPEWDLLLDGKADAGAAHIEGQTGCSGDDSLVIDFAAVEMLVNRKSARFASFQEIRAPAPRRVHLADRAVVIASAWESTGNYVCATHPGSTHSDVLGTLQYYSTSIHFVIQVNKN